jgi:hypothetical protein
MQTSNPSDSLNGDNRTELTDSLLHNDKMRVVLGIISGILAGLVVLGISTLFTSPGAKPLWWLQLMGSAVYGGDAFSFDAPSSVFIVGLLIHLAVSAFCGLLVGKMTRSQSVMRMGTYGLVLGGFCWLASNMFAPDLFDYQVLGTVGQWQRVALFIPFGILIGVSLAVLSRVIQESQKTS